ncbi:hypothetical protein [Paucidesulfovibrio longus]|uniref:hypothetical protein n=1 Tax=Paucidesulfovibrio longus TaxID=889 RepID=UPI0003B3D730|nr:hypothetical protein [Paucidesulfovibrio longus]
MCIVTSDPDRDEGVIKCPGWKFFSWDCRGGIRETANLKPIEKVRDPVEAIRWLEGYKDSVLVYISLQLSLDIPERQVNSEKQIYNAPPCGIV